MNLDSLSFTLSQISYLVDSLAKKNFRDSCQEISLVSMRAHLYIALFLSLSHSRFVRVFLQISFASLLRSLSLSLSLPVCVCVRDAHPSASLLRSTVCVCVRVCVERIPFFFTFPIIFLLSSFDPSSFLYPRTLVMVPLLFLLDSTPTLLRNPTNALIFLAMYAR